MVNTTVRLFAVDHWGRLNALRSFIGRGPQGNRVRNLVSIHIPAQILRLRYPAAVGRLSNNCFKRDVIVCKPLWSVATRLGLASRNAFSWFTPVRRHPTKLFMATQLLSPQVTDDITKTNGVNGKTFKSKNQQRRAKQKVKKAEQKAEPVRRGRSSRFPTQRTSFFFFCPANRETRQLRNRPQCRRRHLTMSSTYLNSWI